MTAPRCTGRTRARTAWRPCNRTTTHPSGRCPAHRSRADAVQAQVDALRVEREIDPEYDLWIDPLGLLDPSDHDQGEHASCDALLCKEAARIDAGWTGCTCDAVDGDHDRPGCAIYQDPA